MPSDIRVPKSVVDSIRTLITVEVDTRVNKDIRRRDSEIKALARRVETQKIRANKYQGMVSHERSEANKHIEKYTLERRVSKHAFVNCIDVHNLYCDDPQCREDFFTALLCIKRKLIIFNAKVKHLENQLPGDNK